MMADNCLEISTSSHVNPLTIVLRDGKAPRISVEARKVNRRTLPDRVRIPPIQELSQQFYRSKFITSIDISSAFLQIGLKKESRKYTNFCLTRTYINLQDADMNLETSSQLL
jgi:hypothetical protein